MSPLSRIPSTELESILDMEMGVPFGFVHAWDRNAKPACPRGEYEQPASTTHSHSVSVVWGSPPSSDDGESAGVELRGLPLDATARVRGDGSMGSEDAAGNADGDGDAPGSGSSVSGSSVACCWFQSFVIEPSEHADSFSDDEADCATDEEADALKFGLEDADDDALCFGLAGGCALGHGAGGYSLQCSAGPSLELDDGYSPINCADHADSRYFEGACWVANYGIDAAASSDEDDDDDDEAEAESCAGACFAFAPDVDERECDWPDGACATADEPPLPLAPFWYGCEDTHHVAAIMTEYAKQLKLNPGRTPSSRAPTEFVGKVRRRQVRIPGAASGFCTVDHVTVYKAEIVPPGQLMPIASAHVLVTSWDDDGLPVSSCAIAAAKLSFWESQCSGGRESTLICRPLFLSWSSFQYDEFGYAVASDDPEISHHERGLPSAAAQDMATWCATLPSGPSAFVSDVPLAGGSA